jgi:cytochrome c oxidase subunit 2
MPSRHPLTLAGRGLGIAGLVATLAGCEYNLLYDGPMTTFVPTTDFGWMIQDIYVLILWMALIVFVVVEGMLFYSIFRYRRRPGQPVPEQLHGNTRLEIAWTIAPALVLVVIAVPTVQTIFATQAEPPNVEQALKVKAIGRQWWFEFQYPDLQITTANELHVQKGQTVYFDLESADVIHAFWFPTQGGKRDMIPGRVNRMWFTPTQVGRHLGQCVEFCGASHANMRMVLYVHEPAEWQAWIAAQKAAAPAPAEGTVAAQGAALFTQKGCAACHAITGNPTAVGRTGPDLTRYGNRSTVAAGMAENNAQNLAAWLRNPQAFKPGALMPNLGLNEDEINSLVAYLHGLK